MSNKQQERAWRTEFNRVCFKRDGYCCRICGKPGDDLVIHHIYDRHDFPNGGYVPENGITVCPDCHWKAEDEHRGFPTEPGYSRAELYALIGTTFDEAWDASEKLSA